MIYKVKITHTELVNRAEQNLQFLFQSAKLGAALNLGSGNIERIDAYPLNTVIPNHIKAAIIWIFNNAPSYLLETKRAIYDNDTITWIDKKRKVFEIRKPEHFMRFVSIDTDEWFMPCVEILERTSRLYLKAWNTARDGDFLHYFEPACFHGKNFILNDETYSMIEVFTAKTLELNGVYLDYIEVPQETLYNLEKAYYIPETLVDAVIYKLCEFTLLAYNVDKRYAYTMKTAIDYFHNATDMLLGKEEHTEDKKDKENK